MTVELEMMNEENGRLRRHIKTLEAELKKQDAAQAQAPDCGCIGPRDCTGECCEKAAVEPEIAMIDAAMVEMSTISPPLRRADCHRLIRAALSAQTAVEPVADDLKFRPDWSGVEVLAEELREALKAMRLALEALNNSVDLVWEEYTEAERNYGNYPTRRAKLDGMKAMAQQHTDAIAALEKEIGE